MQLIIHTRMEHEHVSKLDPVHKGDSEWQLKRDIWRQVSPVNSNNKGASWSSRWTDEELVCL